MTLVRLVASGWLLAGSASGLEAAEAAGVPHATIIVVDQSASMDGQGGIKASDPKKIRQDAASLVIDAAQAGEFIAGVEFGLNARVTIPLSGVEDSRKLALRQQVHQKPGINQRGTDIIEALTNAHALSLEARRQGKRPTVILLTDGKMEATWMGPDGRLKAKYANQDQALKNALAGFKDVPVHCIALGKQADTAFLRNISAATDGGYFTVNSGPELLPVYLQILAAGRGMLSIETNSFYVWPGAQELNVVVFKDEPRTKISAIEAGGTALARQGAKVYWPEALGSYEFARVLAPASGQWNVALDPKGKAQIHVLQSMPFDFQIVAPKGGKEVVGSSVRFAARLQPKPGLGAGPLEAVIPHLSVGVELHHPQDKVETFPLATQAGAFAGEHLVPSPGDYLADFIATFQAPGQAPWQLKARRLFRAGPPDFELVLEQPVAGAEVADPFAPLGAKFGFNKLDPQCPLDAPPPDTAIRAEMFNAKGDSVLLTEWKLAEGKAKDLLNGREPILDPGEYGLRAQARHPDYSIKAAESRLKIGPWPAPGELGLRGKIEPVGEPPFEVGDTPQFQCALTDRGGKPVGLEAMLDPRWRLTAVQFGVRHADRLGKTDAKVAPAASSAAAVAECRVRASGTNELGGTATVSLGLIAGGRPRTAHQQEVSLVPLLFLVGEVEGFSLTPENVAFAGPLRFGAEVRSGTITVANTGEKTLVLLAELGDFKCGEAALPRLHYRLALQGVAAGAERQRTELRLGKGQSAELAIVVDMPSNLGDLVETYPPGVYQAELVVAPVAPGSKLGKAKAVARLERKGEEN